MQIICTQKREIESLSKAAQAMRTNYVKEKLDKTEKNSKCTLCDNRNETVNLIIWGSLNKFSDFFSYGPFYW